MKSEDIARYSPAFDAGRRDWLSEAGYVAHPVTTAPELALLTQRTRPRCLVLPTVAREVLARTTHLRCVWLTAPDDDGQAFALHTAFDGTACCARLL